MEKHVFRVYDTNGDGFIDFIEFMVLFHILSGKTLDSWLWWCITLFSLSDGTPQDVLGKIFRVFDVNSDGTITKKEMQRLVADLFGLIQIQHKDQNQANLKMYLLLKDHGFDTQVGRAVHCLTQYVQLYVNYDAGEQGKYRR